MSILTFDPVAHAYFLDGLELPGVTRTLHVLGGYEGIPAHILQAAADRGTAIHKMTELHDLGTLDYAELDDALIPYLMAWQKFLDDKKPEILSMEQQVYHPALRYAGTYDRILILDGKKALVDLKSSYKLMPATGPQTSAYMEAANAHEKSKTDQIKARFGLKLSKDGTYELQQYKEPTDFNVFVSCLNCLRWLQQHNPKKARLL